MPPFSWTLQAVFDAVNNVRGWRSQTEVGDTGKLSAFFYRRDENAHRCTLNIAEFVPGKKGAWRDAIATGVRLVAFGLGA